ncbi:MAG: hypothetical protein JWP49_2004 [Phenylobacterium sp.]|nr:hypothetical protein [Phenylobacterium sp.]
MRDADDPARSNLLSRIRGIVAGVIAGIVVGALTLVVLIAAFEAFRTHGPVTLVGPDGKRIRVQETSTLRILRSPGQVMVQSCRGACDEFQL